MHEAVKTRMQTIVDGKRIPPVAQLVGFKLVSFEYGKAIFEMRVSQKHHNPMGIVHGGIICDIADAAMGVAFATTLEVDEGFGTINFQINFIRALIEDDLRVEGYLVKRGRSIGFLEAKIFNVKKELVATAQSTCKVLKTNS